MSKSRSAWWQAQEIQSEALHAPFVRWRMVLPLYLVTVGIILAFYAAVPIILLLLQDRNAGMVFFDPDGGGDPVFLQHLLWYLGHPETLVFVTAMVGLLAWVWVLGVWFAGSGWRIGFGRYWRLLVLVGLASVIWVIAPLTLVVSDRFHGLVSSIGVLVFLYLMLRWAVAVRVVVSDRRLRPFATWRETRAMRWVCVWLAFDLFLIGLILHLVLTLIAVLPVQFALESDVELPLWALHLIGFPLDGVLLLLGQVFMGFVMVAAIAGVDRRC